MEKYYLAYGSNLSVAQMAQRCPDAVYVGTAEIENYQLLFKGSQSGSYLTIEPKDGSRVPVLVWKISNRDEMYLDRYEGCPTFYYKKEMTVEMKGIHKGEDLGKVEAIVYIMHEERRLGTPSDFYLQTCIEGYHNFGFDLDVLFEAYRYSTEGMR